MLLIAGILPWGPTQTMGSYPPSGYHFPFQRCHETSPAGIPSACARRSPLQAGGRCLPFIGSGVGKCRYTQWGSIIRYHQISVSQDYYYLFFSYGWFGCFDKVLSGRVGAKFCLELILSSTVPIGTSWALLKKTAGLSLYVRTTYRKLRKEIRLLLLY